VWKISSPPGFDSRIVQPVASSYNDGAIQVHDTTVKNILYSKLWCKFACGRDNEEEFPESRIYVIYR